MNKEELVDWRRVLKTKIKVDAVMYIDTVLFGCGYEKGRAHWDMIEHLCEYTTGATFEDDSSLYLYLHTESQKITDNLDLEIGLQITNTIFQKHTKREINERATKLTDKLIDMVETMLGENDTISNKTKEDIPTKLMTPVRGFSRDA